jgi:hypothetical protein
LGNQEEPPEEIERGVWSGSQTAENSNAVSLHCDQRELGCTNLEVPAPRRKNGMFVVTTSEAELRDVRAEMPEQKAVTVGRL